MKIVRFDELSCLSIILAHEPGKTDRRKREIRLTSRGAEAIASTSVLDAERVRALLKQLEPDERRAAVHGLALLAEGARRLKE